MRLPCPLFALLVGCYAGREPAPEFYDTGPRTVDTTDTAAPPIPDDSWLEVRGTFDLVDGRVAAGHLTAVVHARDANTGSLAPGCTTETDVTEPPATTQPDDDVQLYGIWRVPVNAVGCPGIPVVLDLGLGPLPPTLFGAAEQRDASTRHTRGLYTVDPAGPTLLALGLAGTAEQRAGSGAPASLSPLPDGEYLLEGIYLLPL